MPKGTPKNKTTTRTPRPKPCGKCKTNADNSQGLESVVRQLAESRTLLVTSYFKYGLACGESLDSKMMFCYLLAYMVGIIVTIILDVFGLGGLGTPISIMLIVTAGRYALKRAERERDELIAKTKARIEELVEQDLAHIYRDFSGEGDKKEEKK